MPPRRQRRRPAAALLAAGLCLSAAGPGAAQQGGARPAESPPNPLLTFGFASELNRSDNYDLDPDPAGATTFLDTTLGVTYLTETAAERLELGASGVYRLSNIPQEGTGGDFDDRRLNFGYLRRAANAELSARASYNRADVAFFDPLSLIADDEEILGQDLDTTGGGRRDFTTARLGLRSGLAGPLGLDLSAETRRRDYTGTQSPDLYDSTNEEYRAALSMVLSPARRLSLTGRQADYSAEDDTATVRSNRALFADLEQDLGPAFVLRGSLGYRRITSAETAGGQRGSEAQAGLIGSIGAERALPGGSAGLLFDRSMALSGPRHSLRASRAVDLPAGRLSGSLGASKGEASETVLIGDITYEQELAGGSALFRLARTAGPNSREDDVETTTAAALWQHMLTPVSLMTFSLDYAAIANPAAQDSNRGRLRASYSRDLTPDWQVTGGYEYSGYDREATGYADSNAVFLTIGREFRIRP